MEQPIEGAEDNRILRFLPPSEAEAIREASSPVELQAGQSLYRVGGPFSAVYFPRECVVSVTVELEDGRTVESATIGREGFSGLTLLLGAETSRHQVICQVAGAALRLPATATSALLERTPVFASLLGPYAESLMATMSQSVACLALHPVHERCARWLLATADRTGSGQFRLTHEFLAIMLGVHRPTVSLAANMLQKAGLIEYRRGKVTVLRRAELEAASCECYGVVKGLHNDFLDAAAS